MLRSNEIDAASDQWGDKVTKATVSLSLTKERYTETLIVIQFAPVLPHVNVYIPTFIVGV